MLTGINGHDTVNRWSAPMQRVLPHRKLHKRPNPFGRLNIRWKAYGWVLPIICCSGSYRKDYDLLCEKYSLARSFRTVQVCLHRNYQGLSVTREESGRSLHGKTGFLLFLAGKGHMIVDPGTDAV